MTYVKPGITINVGSASAPGGTNQQGRVIALIGSFPKGPVWPGQTLPGSNFPSPFPVPAPSTYLAYNLQQLMATWGDDHVSNDLSGWTGPGYGRLIYENDRGLTPVVFAVRTGTTQASATVPNGTGLVVWTATALLTIGGSAGNGITCQLASTTFTITPPASLTGFATESFTVPSTPTWSQVAAVVNGQSKLIFLNSASADTTATAGTTLATLASGADGATPTASQINSGTDTLSNLTYSQQPIHIIAPAFADSATGGVIKHALTDAIANVANGQYSRVIGGVTPSAGGTGNLTTILAMGTDLVPAEGSPAGDSGRVVLWGNNQPYRLDPATGIERLYPGWAPAAAWAGQTASAGGAQPLGHAVLNGFTRFAEQYTVTERTGSAGLLAGGVMVVGPLGRCDDQVTTAILASYRREDSVARAESIWIPDLVFVLNTLVIETASGPSAGVVINNRTDLSLRGYVDAGLIQGYSFTTVQSTQDARNWIVNVNYNPILPVRGITLNITLLVGAGSTAAQLLQAA